MKMQRVGLLICLRFKAIAIDMSRSSWWSDEPFNLPSLTAATIVVTMRAPSGDAAVDYIAQSGAWGDSAMAYNEVYLQSTVIDEDTGNRQENMFVRKDYTKVGLSECKLNVTKIWDDDDDRDGLRPDEVTVRLRYREINGADHDADQFLVLNESNNWFWYVQ